MTASRKTAPIIIDCSLAMSWIFEDERDQASLAAAQYVQENGALVPALWRWEVQNALLSALRRNRITEAELTSYFADVRSLAIQVNYIPHFGSEIALARQYGLTAYDAAYIDLALRTNCLIASKDEQLEHAARAIGLCFPVG